MRVEIIVGKLEILLLTLEQLERNETYTAVVVEILDCSEYASGLSLDFA
jgi:hypothetical protein